VRLLSTLSRLTPYVTTLGRQEETLLRAVAPHVGVEYNAEDFIKQLDRLADDSPAAVSRVLVAVLAEYKPDYDFEDRLKKPLAQAQHCVRRHGTTRFGLRSNWSAGSLAWLNSIRRSHRSSRLSCAFSVLGATTLAAVKQDLAFSSSSF